MPTLAVTLVGADRRGIIAAVTRALADLEGNVEDSSMTILRGHFAMSLVVVAPCTAEEVGRALHAVVDPLGLTVTVAELPPEEECGDEPAAHVVLAVHGADRLGLVARFMAVVAGHGGNVTDLTTRLADGLYVVVADIDLPQGADQGALDADVRVAADELGVDAFVRSGDADLL